MRLELHDRIKNSVLLTPRQVVMGTLLCPLCDKSNLTCPILPHVVIRALTISHSRACPCYTCLSSCCVAISPETSGAQNPTLSQIISQMSFNYFHLWLRPVFSLYLSNSSSFLDFIVSCDLLLFMFCPEIQVPRL